MILYCSHMSQLQTDRQDNKRTAQHHHLEEVRTKSLQLNTKIRTNCLSEHKNHRLETSVRTFRSQQAVWETDSRLLSGEWSGRRTRDGCQEKEHTDRVIHIVKSPLKLGPGWEKMSPTPPKKNCPRNPQRTSLYFSASHRHRCAFGNRSHPAAVPLPTPTGGVGECAFFGVGVRVAWNCQGCGTAIGY